MILPTRLDEAIASFTRLVYQRWRSGHAVHDSPSGWAESGVAHRILESGRLTQKHWARVERASTRLCKAPVHILAGRPISPEVLGMSIAAIGRQVTQRQVVLIHATGPQTADARHVGAP